MLFYGVYIEPFKKWKKGKGFGKLILIVSRNNDNKIQRKLKKTNTFINNTSKPDLYNIACS